MLGNMIGRLGANQRRIYGKGFRTYLTQDSLGGCTTLWFMEWWSCRRGTDTGGGTGFVSDMADALRDMIDVLLVWYEAGMVERSGGWRKGTVGERWVKGDSRLTAGELQNSC